MDYLLEEFDLVFDEDLQSTSSCDRMILVCKKCGALFQMKGNGIKNISIWYGYHPSDGNMCITNIKFAQKNSDKCAECNNAGHEMEDLVRVTTVKQLKNIINKV